MDQHTIPAETPGVTQYEFMDWVTSEAAQRALLEIDCAMSAARILFNQMWRKRAEIGRSMGDLSSGIARSAKEYAAMAAGLETF